MKKILRRAVRHNAVSRSNTAKLIAIGSTIAFITPAQEASAVALSLSGTSYTENFDGIGSGLPTGWSANTGATATVLGNTAAFATGPIQWSDSGAGFKNFAAASATSSASTATQAAATDRAFGVRQTGTSSTDPGAAFTLQLNDTIGLTDFKLGVDMEMLNIQPRSTTWTVRYGIGVAPTSFTNVTTHADPGVFGVTNFSNLDLSAISNQSDNVWIQIVAVTASTGSGNRDSFGIDNFSLTYLSGVKSYFDTNGSTAGVGVNGGTVVWDTTTANWNDSPGTGTSAPYSPSAVAIFAGTAGTVDTAVGGVTASGGVQFDSDGYVIQGDALTLNTNNTVGVTTIGQTATLNTQLSGSVGLNKTGSGKLVLGSVLNNFSGGVSITSGTLSISDNGNLGDVNNNIVLATGTLRTAVDVTVASTHSVNGAGGLDVAAAKTLTIDGAVGDTTPVALSMVNAGTVALTGVGVKSLASLSFTNSGTLSITGSDLTIGGNVTTTNTTGTASVNGNVSMSGTGTRIFNVSNGSAATDLLMSGNISGTVLLHKLGPGTLVLTGNNSGLGGTGTPIAASFRIGLGATAAAVPTEGGTVEFNNPDALGTGQLQLNAGTLRNTSGGPLVITNANGISTGASDHVNSPGGIVFEGGDMTFTGPFSLFRSSTTGFQHRITVNNTTTLDGSIVATAGSAVSTGFTIGGTGKFVLNNATNTADVPVTVQDATLEINGGLTLSNVAAPSLTASLTVAPTGKVVTNSFQLGSTSILNVNGIATVRANGGVAGASKVETLTIGDGGKLDLKDNDLVVGSAANVTAVRDQIKLGKTNNAPSGITSDAALFGSKTGFGYAMGDDPNLSPLLTNSSLLTGQSFDTDSVLVKYTFLGDADLDGDTDLNDLGKWASNFTGDLNNPAVPAKFWTQGDFDYDGDTDLNDLGKWSSNFTGDLNGGAGSLIVYAPGASASAVAVLNGMGITVVPEPSTFVLAGVGLVGLVIAARRKRRA